MDFEKYGGDPRWHMPAMLRWIDDNRTATHTPSGALVGHTLRQAAEMLEQRGLRIPEATEPQLEACYATGPAEPTDELSQRRAAKASDDLHRRIMDATRA